jgi:hypothetical protein
MPSPGSLLIARWFLAPATLMWCRLLLDNPAERVIRAWSGALLRQATVGMSGSVAYGVPQLEPVEQVRHRRDMPAPAVAGEHAAGVQLAGDGPEAGCSARSECRRRPVPGPGHAGRRSARWPP